MSLPTRLAPSWTRIRTTETRSVRAATPLPVAPPPMPVFRTAGSILFLTGPRTAIRRNLERPLRSRLAVTVPRLIVLLHPPRAIRTP